jgi:hypothetical protein
MTTILLSLLSPAWALDCTGLNADTCQAVNELAAAVNFEVGSTLISDNAAQTRFRTANIYARLDAVRQAATNTGCRDDGSFEGWAGGRYNSGNNGFFQGYFGILGVISGPMSGDVDRSTFSFEGTVNGAAPMGNEFSKYNTPGRLLANVVDSDTFLGGIWVRTSGNNGVYLALVGECSNDVDVQAAFGNWYSGASGFTFRTDAPAAYSRVERMGMPAVNTALISSPNKNAYNAASPADDRAGLFVASDIGPNLIGLHAALDDDLIGLGLTPCDLGTCVAQGGPLVLPDTLQVDGSGTSSFPNGRNLPDQVIDLTLAVILLDLSVHPVSLFAGLPLNPPANDAPFYGDFPFLASPN